MKQVLSPYLILDNSESSSIKEANFETDNLDLIHATSANDIEKVKRLLQNDKIDINFKEETWGNTALHCAYLNNSNDSHEEIIRLLEEAGADIKIINDKGHTPREVNKMQHISDNECWNSLFNLKTLEDFTNSTQKVQSWFNDIQTLNSLFPEEVSPQQLSTELAGDITHFTQEYTDVS